MVFCGTSAAEACTLLPPTMPDSQAGLREWLARRGPSLLKVDKLRRGEATRLKVKAPAILVEHEHQHLVLGISFAPKMRKAACETEVTYRRDDNSLQGFLHLFAVAGHPQSASIRRLSISAS